MSSNEHPWAELPRSDTKLEPPEGVDRSPWTDTTHPTVVDDHWAMDGQTFRRADRFSEGVAAGLAQAAQQLDTHLAAAAAKHAEVLATARDDWERDEGCRLTQTIIMQLGGYIDRLTADLHDLLEVALQKSMVDEAVRQAVEQAKRLANDLSKQIVVMRGSHPIGQRIAKELCARGVECRHIPGDAAEVVAAIGPTSLVIDLDQLNGLGRDSRHG